MKNYKEVMPCGWLHSQGKKFFLLKPYPIVGDSWERDNMARFWVVPHIEYMPGKAVRIENPNEMPSFGEHYKMVYPHARHVVVSGFCLEYQADMPTILYETVKEEVNNE